MTVEYTYKCKNCGGIITSLIHYSNPHLVKHYQMNDDTKCRGSMYRVWTKTPVIFKAQGYSKNNLTK